ncbi:hypothetical protein JCGZ_11198 [Jatropha curcas]|uniref:Clp R domain-containing protein n=1 Tax=Jatropha curcas TaxID=180498 RepID=A0A067KF38_JATCU|nr:protein SMAX1-LIKE 6 [Jatropha curcas]KDP34836.1 hypothetical protein JCGZ_11198 [Jatropha curcas]
MPTPVSVARQCLTDEAARALDDAVAVARRRSHAQTTSLHAVSALLALPSSILRDACARARNSPCSSRLQFRALELCVGVSLDRLSSSKTLEEPPISNSLMAAIKRSQANQRRHPDNFHLQQIHCNQQPPSVLKVELKYFILSILDDPIVSRVLGEAGFRSCDIKLAIIHPPVTPQAAKFSRTRYPPLFLYNLTGSDPVQPGLSFPFSGREDVDEDCRRVSEALMKRNGRGKNLLLLGVCAGDALNRFIECVNMDKEKILPSEISGLRVISIEKEIVEFVSEGGKEREKMGLKFEELRNELDQCSGPGVLLNVGELKGLVNKSDSIDDALSYLVSKLTGLVEGFRDKLWLMGAAAKHETYSKLLGQFPAIEKDWDLHILPITSSKSPFDCFGSKSSLMGSFVPFGGFFSTPSDFRNPSININQSITRCHLCTAKYEQEVAEMLKMGSKISVADQHSENLPSWLQMAHLDTGKGFDAAKTKNDGTTLNEKILGLQKKWNGICQQLHHAQPFSNFDISQSRPQASMAEGFPYVADRKERSSSSSSCSRDSSLNENQYANLGLGIHMDLQNFFPSKYNIPLPVASEAENVNYRLKLLKEASKSQQKEKDGPLFTPLTLPYINLPTDHPSSLSVTSVTTDLGLGTLYASSSQKPNKSKLSDYKEHFQHLTGFNSSGFGASESTHKIKLSSSCSNPSVGGHLDLRDYKSIREALLKRVGWQEEAISAISQAICQCKAGYGRNHGSIARGDIWLSFLGPDKVGKRRIASILAEIVFGSHENLIPVDLSFHDGGRPSETVFGCQELNDYDAKFRGKTVVDYIAMELSKKPHSVVLLENVDKADFLVQTSLSKAVRTGKFPNSLGREISINNMIFVTTSTIVKDNVNLSSLKEHIKLSEESIIGAKSWQMQILIEHVTEGASKRNEMSVKVSRKATTIASLVNKRKLDRITSSTEQEFNYEARKRASKVWGSSLDLNLPVEGMEENTDSGICDSDSISENSEAWLEDFFDQIDEKVLFKPFDFDALAEKIVSEINIQFQKVFGLEMLLEIDDEAMLQMLAASWSSDVNRAMEDWVERVLGRGFVEARQKYHVTVPYVVKLVTCKGVSVEERAPGICLPARINL